jgi:hypothetical protein
LHDDNADQENGQDGPDDNKDPDVDLLIGNAKDLGPVHQHVHTPIEDLIHHFCLLFCVDDRILHEIPFQNLAGTLMFKVGFDILFLLS